jgi:hypothetical protein
MVFAGVALLILGWLLLGKIMYDVHKATGETHFGGYGTIKAHCDEYRHLFPNSQLPEWSIACMVAGFFLIVLRAFLSLMPETH